MPEKAEMAEDMQALVAKSLKTDIQVLLTAKENAKRAALEEPSQANLAALDRASKMLESAMQTTTSLKDWNAALSYINDNGRKLGKTKMFEDIRKGRLKKQPDGSFRIKDVERYMASLPMAGTGDLVAEKAADRQRRREEEEIRRIKAVADREEFNLEVQKGRFISRDDVFNELAARAVTMASGLKTAFESRSLDLIDLVEGNPRKSAAFFDAVENILDTALNEYSREIEFEVIFEEARHEQEDEKENDNQGD